MNSAVSAAGRPLSTSPRSLPAATLSRTASKIAAIHGIDFTLGLDGLLMDDAENFFDER